MSAFRRKRLKVKAAQSQRRKSRLAASLRIDIDEDGDIEFPPVIVQQVNALAMLKIVLGVSVYLVDVYAGRAF